jgi:C1A family cysteine protease
MTEQGFAPVNNQSSTGADFMFSADASLEFVFVAVQNAVKQTGKHFAIFVNEVSGKGIGLIA